jgi:flagellar biosynthesis/type III secretory pathway chaperone
MNRPTKAGKPLKSEKRLARLTTLSKQLEVVTGQRDALLKTLDENSQRAMLRLASRGSYDRAALKCLVASQRELLWSLEALIRGSEA